MKKTMAVEIIDIGNDVFCDLCNADFTHRDDAGGFLFQSKAVCPDCAPRFLKQVEDYGEQQYIRGYCPPGMSYRDWCLSLRNGDNTIKIFTEEK